MPRPIALVTTIDAQGVVNAAPFSMFNMLGEEPPIVMISINRLKDGALKDTAANIVRSRRVRRAPGRRGHRRADAPLRRAAAAGRERARTRRPDAGAVARCVAPPRIAEAPVAFECTLWETLETESRQIFIGRVLRLHAREA